jgi:hypothetical protein
MASERFRRAVRRSLIPALIALIAVGIASLAAVSDEPSKPGPVAHPEGAFAALQEAAPTAGTVPARAPLPDGVTCPDGWTYFDNPVMHYGVCVPGGWGFSDFRQAAPLDQIPVIELENLHLLGNAFPWRPGTLPFDAVRQGALDVELDVLPASAQTASDCQPTIKRMLGKLSVLTCEQLYDDLGLPASIGTLRAFKVIVPLASSPADERGARLQIIARTRTSASASEVTTLWQIVQSVHAY